MKERPASDLLLPRKQAGAPPRGWVAESAPPDGADLFRIVLKNEEQNSEIILEVTNRDTSSIAHCRTRRFNIRHVSSRNVKSPASAHKVLKYYFGLFLANDGEQARDDQQRNRPEPARPGVRIAFKPTVRRTEKTLGQIARPEPAPDIAAHSEILLSHKVSALEKAFYISDPYDLKFFPIAPFQRIYFGNEYCEHLLPSPAQLERMLAFAAERSLPLTLTTPFCTESAFIRIEELFDLLPLESEVVFNDWALVPSITERGLTPIHGRLLWKIRKDPRVDASGPGAEYHRMHNLQSLYQDYLEKRSVPRVELDNVRQGADLSLNPTLSSSLYFSSVCCAVTRKCVFANQTMGRRTHTVHPGCGKTCAGRIIELSLQGTRITVQGNAHFYHNQVLPRFIKNQRINRLVYMPVLPNHNRFADKDVCYLDWSYVFRNKDIANLWGETPDEQLAALLDKVKISENARVLDAGCGAGRNTPLLSRRNWRYHGMDISRDAVEKARSRLPHCTFSSGDILDGTGPDGLFDMVVDIGCFHTIPPYRRVQYLHRIHSLLRPDGVFILAAWLWYEPQEPMYYVMDQIPEWGCATESLKPLIRKRFCIKETRQSPGWNQDMMYWLMKKL